MLHHLQFSAPIHMLKKSECKPAFALLIHAPLSGDAADETRGWGLLSPLLIVFLSMYYFIIYFFPHAIYSEVWRLCVVGEARRGGWRVGRKLVGQFIILFLPCQVKTRVCSPLCQRAVITIGKQWSHF